MYTKHAIKHYIIIFIQTFSQVRMQTLAYISTSWSTPCSSVWIGSELHIKQNEPIPRFGVFDTYNASLLVILCVVLCIVYILPGFSRK